MPTSRRETENPIGNDLNNEQNRDNEERSNFDNRTDDSAERGNKEVTDKARLNSDMQNSEEHDDMLDDEENENDEDMDEMSMDDDDFDDDEDDEEDENEDLDDYDDEDDEEDDEIIL